MNFNFNVERQTNMKRRCRRMALQLETMEPRELLSGLMPALKIETNVLARRILADALHKATTHDIRHMDARQRVLLAQAEARAQHALVKLQGNRHANVLAGRLHSAVPASKTLPSNGSKIFEAGKTFNFRAFNSNVSEQAGISKTEVFAGGFTLTVKPHSLPPLRTGFRPEVLDLDFQYAKPLLKINNPAKDHLTFGPIGSPVRVPVLQPVTVTGVYIYFTLNGQRVNNTKTFGPLFKLKADPLDPSRTDLFLPTDFSVDPKVGFYVLNGVNNSGNGLTLWPEDFDAKHFNVPNTVNGMHILITVTPK